MIARLVKHRRHFLRHHHGAERYSTDLCRAARLQQKPCQPKSALKRQGTLCENSTKACRRMQLCLSDMVASSVKVPVPVETHCCDSAKAWGSDQGRQVKNIQPWWYSYILIMTTCQTPPVTSHSSHGDDGGADNCFALMLLHGPRPEP